MAAKKERKNAAVVKQPSQFVGRGQIRFVTVSAPLKNKFRGELPFKFSFFPIKKFAIHFNATNMISHLWHQIRKSSFSVILARL